MRRWSETCRCSTRGPSVLASPRCGDPGFRSAAKVTLTPVFRPTPASVHLLRGSSLRASSASRQRAHCPRSMPLEPTSFHSLTSCLLYVYGTGNDQPLGVKRLKYAEKVSGVVTPFPAFGWAPHWNVRGQADGGSAHDGGRSPCINASTCLKRYNWPASYSPYAQQYRVRGGWQGTLLEDKRDMSGSLFRRERYLDPASGRFTQEDPIGLAGGMNLYGFAGGDPVNFSDPMGLCPWTDCITQAITNWGAKRGAAIGAVALNGGAALAAGLEAVGINMAAEAGDRIGNGDILGGGAMAAAAALPVGRVGGAALRASERLHGEAIAGIGAHSIAGVGAKKEIGDIARLVSTYGGEAGDWAKMVGRTETAEGRLLQIHWYENAKTGFKTEFKHNLPP